MSLDAASSQPIQRSLRPSAEMDSGLSGLDQPLGLVLALNQLEHRRRRLALEFKSGVDGSEETERNRTTRWR